VLAATRLGGGGTKLLLHTTLTAPSAEEAARLLAPLDAAPPAVAHERGPTTIAEENVAMTRQNPYEHRYAADSQWTDAGAAELYPRLRELYEELPSEHSFSIWYGWAASRELPDMAFSLERNVYLATYAIWTDPADDERHRDWVHGHTARLAEVGEGVYVGDSDFSRRPDRYLADVNAARLAQIRATRDPDGVFGVFR
jgi:FAD/FMN-containing dehydrogenase